jgi:hypothetical protein
MEMALDSGGGQWAFVAALTRQWYLAAAVVVVVAVAVMDDGKAVVRGRQQRQRLTVAAAAAGCNSGHQHLMELQPECAWQSTNDGCIGAKDNKRRQKWGARGRALRGMLILF